MSISVLLLERLGALVHQSVRDDAVRHGLLPIHLQVLAYLARANRYSDIPIAIAEYFGLTRGTVSQSLALLERRGLVVRQADARHGRRVHLQLTPQGQAVLDDGWSRQIGEALGAAADAPRVERVLRELLRGLQRRNGQRAFGICHQCAHFRRGDDGDARCGLTGEPLVEEQSRRICREWTDPAVVAA